MSVSSTTGMITDLVADIGSVLGSAIPTVLGVAAALVGLFFAWKLVKKFVGGSK